MNMSISDLFLYLSLGLVILWTVRLARSKGQNPWIWGGVSILLMVIPEWRMLGMIPMVVLLFFRRSSRASSLAGEATVICPKCSTHHASGHNYCVNCGWQLDRAYSQEADHQPVNSPAATAEPISQGEIAQETPAPVFVSEQAAPAEEVIPAEEPPPPPPPARKPARRLTITAASMTERGIALFTQGKIQEAVDQFTKAIALDPNYQPAWAQRAEAYLRLGLSQKAEEDQRRLKAI